MMDWLNSLVSDVNSVLWGVFCLIPLLCGTGIFYTIRLRFVQVRKFGLALKILSATHRSSVSAPTRPV